MKRFLRSDLFNICLLLVLAGILYGFHLGSPGLIDPDEPFYSLTAKEMLARRDASTPVLFGAPQFEKPIFFYWVLYVCGKLFGMTETAMRLGPCLAGILTVLVTYGWARTVWRRSDAAFVSAAILMTAGEFVVLSRLVLTDIFLCLFTTSAFACLSWGYARPRARAFAWILASAAMAMGFLTKGPLGALIPASGFFAYLAVSGEPALLKGFPWKRGFAIFAVIALPWFALMTARYGAEFLRHFFVHENVRRFFVAEHRSSNTPFFYPLICLAGFFPWSGFLPGALARTFARAGKHAPERFLALCVAVPFVFFTLAQSKLVSYILPIFPPLAILTGGWAVRAGRALRKTAPRPALAAWLFAAWVVLPSALVAITWWYGVSQKLELEKVAVVFAAALMPMPAAFFCIFRRRPAMAFVLALSAAFAFALACFALFLPAIDAHFSSRKDVLAWRAASGGASPARPPFFLASKMVFRGVSYYTGTARLGVFGENAETAFYTRPALPLFSKRDDLARIPDGDFPVYGFLRPKDGRLLRTFAGAGEYVVTAVDSDGQKEIVRLDRLKVHS